MLEYNTHCIESQTYVAVGLRSARRSTWIRRIQCSALSRLIPTSASSRVYRSSGSLGGISVSCMILCIFSSVVITGLRISISSCAIAVNSLSVITIDTFPVRMSNTSDAVRLNASPICSSERPSKWNDTILIRSDRDILRDGVSCCVAVDDSFCIWNLRYLYVTYFRVNI